MSESLEKQWVVSRARTEGWKFAHWKPWKLFDGREQARSFVAAQKSKVYEYRIDPVTRGPRG